MYHSPVALHGYTHMQHVGISHKARSKSASPWSSKHEALAAGVIRSRGSARLPDLWGGCGIHSNARAASSVSNGLRSMLGWR